MGPITALIIAGLATAGLSAAASVGSSAINAASQKSTNEYNLQQAREANQTSIELANTAHQREMADLKAAGLNPVLTATGGNGAPVAAINTPQAQAPQIDLNGVSSALNSITNLLLVSKMLGGAANLGKAFASFNSAKGLQNFRTIAQIR